MDSLARKTCGVGIGDGQHGNPDSASFLQHMQHWFGPTKNMCSSIFSMHFWFGVSFEWKVGFISKGFHDFASLRSVTFATNPPAMKQLEGPV